MSSVPSFNNQSSKTPKLSVAICGGGIAGLLLAVGLSKHDDIEVKLYEAAESLQEIGAGLTIWGRAFEVLSRMGLDHDMRLAEDVPSDGLHDPTFNFDMRKSDQPEEGFMWHALTLPYTSISFHRAHFLNVIVKQFPMDMAHFSKRLATYSELADGTIALEFADGTSATCDVLLGCDGIRSAVRRTMYEHEAACQSSTDLLKYVEPVFSGSVMYRTLLPAELLTNDDGIKHPAMCAPKMYCGRDEAIITYPIAGGSICNFVAVVTNVEAIGKTYDGPWTSESTVQEAMDWYTSWEPQAKNLLNVIHPRKPSKWAVHELTPLPFSVSGRVALVGDAAHAMTPFQGAGAGQAIEDAYVLAGLLAHPSTTRETAALALKAYEHVRLPMAKRVMQCSRETGRIIQLAAEYEGDYDRLRSSLQSKWDWVSGPGPHAELERAIQWCYPGESVGISA